MRDFKNKKVLLLYAKFFNYDKIVSNKLKELGAEVDLFDARAELSQIEKAILKVYKGFFYSKLNHYHRGIIEKQSGIEYDFIFSNSYLPPEIIQDYRAAFPNAKLILYLDDSVRNTPNVEKTFPLYDVVKTFDRVDAINYNLVLQPLFFADSYSSHERKEKEYDLCFIGTIHSDRLKVIESVDKICKEKGLKFYHYSYLQSHFIYYYYCLTQSEFRKVPKSFFKFSQIPSNEVSDVLSKSLAVLDIQHPKQTGLTMRTIETLGAGKKIITTNNEIKHYDIFNEYNICVIDRENPDIPDVFLSSDYKAMDENILKKYSLEGWLISMFDIK